MLLRNKLIKQNFLYLILSFLFFLFCVHRLFFISPGIFESLASYIAYPFVSMQGKLAGMVNSYHENSSDVQSLKVKIDAVQKEKDDLFAENIQLKSALAYLEQVSELIEFKKKFHVNVIATAQIMSKYIAQTGHFCFIDKGSNDGIDKGMVSVYKNCLLGKITEVYPAYSKMIFITDKECKVAAYCFKTLAMGIYQGTNRLDSADLNFVNHLDKLEIDDLLISSGEGLIFPQGFILGKISKFSSDEIQYKASIKPIIDINSIKYCQIVRK